MGATIVALSWRVGPSGDSHKRYDDVDGNSGAETTSKLATPIERRELSG